MITALASDVPAALKAISAARAMARARVWALAGAHAPDHGAGRDVPVAIDLDATLVTAHSEKEHAAPTFKKGFGFHPLWAFLDHGAAGTGEPLAVKLRAGNAGSNTVADHIEVTRQALAQLPGHRPGTRPGRRVLVRADGAGGTHGFLDWLTGQRLSYSVGFHLPDDIAERLALIPDHVWVPAIDADGEVRDGAWVAEVTGVLDPKILATWPKGMRVIVRKERPHPGAQLRLTDVDGHRLTAFATNTRPGPGGQLPDLELRHRRRARAEDRIRVAMSPQGHRAGEPPPARLRPEPDLVRPGRHGLRGHRMDPAPCLHHRGRQPPGPAVGTQAAPAPIVLRRRPADPFGTTLGAALRPTRRLDSTPARRARPTPGPPTPADRSPWLTHWPSELSTQPEDPCPAGTGAHPERHRETVLPLRQNQTPHRDDTAAARPLTRPMQDPG